MTQFAEPPQRTGSTRRSNMPAEIARSLDGLLHGTASHGVRNPMQSLGMKGDSIA